MNAIKFWVPSNRVYKDGTPKGFDGFNEIIKANRTNKHVGAKQERENLQNVIDHATAALHKGGFKPIKGMACVWIEIVEPNKRRDVSNVLAATKYLLDGLTRARGNKPGAGLIYDDSPAHCRCYAQVTYTKGCAGAWVTIQEKTGGDNL